MREETRRHTLMKGGSDTISLRYAEELERLDHYGHRHVHIVAIYVKMLQSLHIRL
jgi:hypothetical protein